MPVPASSLSVAMQGVAEFLDGQFGEDVKIIIAHPNRAADIAKGANGDAHHLNIFAYRVAPSGFHADAGSGDTQFIRVSTLLTPFPNEGEAGNDDADLRILGHAIRVLQSHPVLPITAAPLPGADLPVPPAPKSYRLEAVMLAPPMEEMNHIWTTQGDIAYRLSAAYEFALIPVEPLTPREVASPPTTLMIDAGLGVQDAALAFNPPSADDRAFPLTTADGTAAAPVAWAPVQMLVDGDALTSALEIAAAVAEVDIALAGPVGDEAAVEITWADAGGAETPQPAQIIAIASAALDAAEAQTTLALAPPADAVSAVILARAAAGGAAVPGAAYGNALTLSVAGGGP